MAVPVSPGSSHSHKQDSSVLEITLDDELDTIGIGRFHWLAGVVCGIANASDAVEMMSIGYILPEFNETSTATGTCCAAL